MTTLYALAAQRRALVAGTGNKVEDFGVGFYTKYGDGGVDVSPIADLVKTQKVFALGAALGVEQEVLDAPPTDGLWGDDRTDEDQLGATYPELRMGHGQHRCRSLDVDGAPARGHGGLHPPQPGQPAQDESHPGLPDSRALAGLRPNDYSAASTVTSGPFNPSPDSVLNCN